LLLLPPDVALPFPHVQDAAIALEADGELAVHRVLVGAGELGEPGLVGRRVDLARLLERVRLRVLQRGGDGLRGLLPAVEEELEEPTAEGAGDDRVGTTGVREDHPGDAVVGQKEHLRAPAWEPAAVAVHLDVPISLDAESKAVARLLARAALR